MRADYLCALNIRPITGGNRHVLQVCSSSRPDLAAVLWYRNYSIPLTHDQARLLADVLKKVTQ